MVKYLLNPTSIPAVMDCKSTSPNSFLIDTAILRGDSEPSSKAASDWVHKSSFKSTLYWVINQTFNAKTFNVPC